MSGQTAPPNTKLTNIETYKISKTPLVNAMEAHDSTTFSGQNSPMKGSKTSPRKEYRLEHTVSSIR